MAIVGGELQEVIGVVQIMRQWHAHGGQMGYCPWYVAHYCFCRCEY